MVFALFPDPPVAPRTVPAGGRGDAGFVQSAGTPVPEFTGIYERMMFLRVAMIGGSVAPTVFMQAGRGPAVAVAAATQPVFRATRPDGAGTGFVGDVFLVPGVGNVLRLVVGFDRATEETWTLGIRNNDPSAERHFTWVVADSEAETVQPWVDPGSFIPAFADPSFTPDAGTAGTAVSLSGRNFNVGIPRVSFGTAAASLLAPPAAGSLTVAVPEGLVTPGQPEADVPVSVETAAGTAQAAASFRILAWHDDAEFVSQDHIPEAMRPGSTATVTIIIRNSGNTTWTSGEGYRLGAQAPAGNSTWGSAWHELPGPVASGEDVAFTFSISAPEVAGALFSWQMVRDRTDTGAREWFGPRTPEREIGLSISNARFVAQSVPASIPRFSTAAVTVTMRNTGTTTWQPSEGYRLGAIGNDFGAARHELTGAVSPGQDTTFSFNIPAPSTPALFQWRMLQESVEWFGTPSEPVQITPGEPLECATLRQKIKGLEVEIRALQKLLQTAGPGEKPAIAAQIKMLQQERTRAVARFTELGCRA
ncbi:hypothetical protein [Arthrobacter humicola]|uniref:hypothetical protein n=1 Tax=Arthrobacter humicola TaxID=409291 RepID=UPI001FAD3402|nr:hypothetical protein [Arthrobacter humicola]MCI9870558.1 IPT/TIG domain-containing protein [Arthrobacter humicola]